jgi:hypothetical protein
MLAYIYMHNLFNVLPFSIYHEYIFVLMNMEYRFICLHYFVINSMHPGAELGVHFTGEAKINIIIYIIKKIIYLN